MLSAPFGCSVFDVGRVGTYREARSISKSHCVAHRKGRKVSFYCTYPQVAWRNIATEKRQSRATLLLRPPHRRRDLPPDLNAIRPRAATRVFGRVPRPVARVGQALIQERGERWRGAWRTEE